MKFLKKSVFVTLMGCLCIPFDHAFARGDQWYIGVGGGAAWLQPNPLDSSIDLDARQGFGGNAFFGVDIDDRSSAQLTLYGLGEAELDNNEVVPFYAVDGSVLYRLYDTNDRRLVPSTLSLALYGRFALGYIERDTDIPLNNDAAVYFGAGGGAELFLTRNLSLRVEGMYHDRDAASGSLQLVARFGGTNRLSTRPPVTPSAIPDSPALPQAPAVPQAPQVAQVPQAPQVPQVPSAPAQNRIADADGDRVPNASDQCPGSTSGFPVRANGCALLDGVLSGVNFSPRSSLLLPESTAQLDYLANVLSQYPEARIELHSHTDDQGSVREQAILTRGRLRTIGTYLVGRGVRANRLTLRSFGGTRPLYDNSTSEGRAGNNRIEVLEKGSQ